MALLFSVHPANPQPRLLKQAAHWLKDGGLVAIPTDSSYAVTARLDDKAAADALRRLRGLDERHPLTLLCRDLAEISHFARVDNRQYRLIKAATPGPWTFILEATREVPRRVAHPSRKTIGIRVPDHSVALGLLEQAGAPLLSTTLIPKNEEEALNDAELIRERYGHDLAAIIDAGACSRSPTTVIDLTRDEPLVQPLLCGAIFGEQNDALVRPLPLGHELRAQPGQQGGYSGFKEVRHAGHCGRHSARGSAPFTGDDGVPSHPRQPDWPATGPHPKAQERAPPKGPGKQR